MENYFDIVIAEMQSFLDENGFKGEAGVFANETKSLKVEYDEAAKLYKLFSADISDGNVGEYALASSYLFDEKSDKKDAVFLSINSYEAAIFTLKYTVQPQPYAALGILSKFGITADLAVKDFSVTERLVENRFAVGRKLLHVPELAIKEAYWNDELGKDVPVCAILTRDSALAFLEVVGGARCLIRTVRLGLFCAYACSLIGMITMYFLAAMDKIYLASPENIVLYLLIWLLPVRFASLFMTRY